MDNDRDDEMQLSGESAVLAYAAAMDKGISEEEAVRRALHLFLWLSKQTGGLALTPRDITALLEGRKPW